MSLGVISLMKKRNPHHTNRYKDRRVESSVLAGLDDPHFPPFRIRPNTPHTNENSVFSEEELTPPPSTQPRAGRTGLSLSDIANTMHTFTVSEHSEHLSYLVRELNDVQGISNPHRDRKDSPFSDLPGTPQSQSSSDDRRKRRRLIAPDGAEGLSDNNGGFLGHDVSALERVLMKIAKEAREDRQEMNSILREIAGKLDHLAPRP